MLNLREKFNPSISKYSYALACKIVLQFRLHNSGYSIQTKIRSNVPGQDFQTYSFHIKSGAQHLSKRFHNQLGVPPVICMCPPICEEVKK